MRESKAKFFGGMADSPEYRTLTHHQSEMVKALADEVDQLTDELFAKGLISGDDAKTVKNPYLYTILFNGSTKTRASQCRRLTELILNRVKRNPRDYDVFIDVLSQREDEHREILEVLGTSYKQFSEFLLS